MENDTKAKKYIYSCPCCGLSLVSKTNGKIFRHKHLTTGEWCKGVKEDGKK